MEERALIFSFAAALGLAAVHLFSNHLRVLDGVPRHFLLSVAGGISVTYVVLRLLPAVNQGQKVIVEKVEEDSPLSFLEQHVYILVLLGLFIFYGLEDLARSSKEKRNKEKKKAATSTRVFWLHMLTFAALNAVIGYLLVSRTETGLSALLLFFIAMFLKFIVNDNGLHRLHREGYDRKGRWILSAAVFLGWGISAFSVLPDSVPVLLQSFLAGGVLLNVLKEELPVAGKSNYWAFFSGGLAYAILLIILSSQESG